MGPKEFQLLLQPVTDYIAGKEINQALAEALNRKFPPASELFESIEEACHQAMARGWMCAEGGQGRRFGRVIEPSDETGRLSVDVVDLTNIVGPHHRHPTGEICMVMPVDERACFDGYGRGWCIYEPESEHRPTVTEGEALVLYMLPEGKIEFTGRGT